MEEAPQSQTVPQSPEQESVPAQSGPSDPDHSDYDSAGSYTPEKPRSRRDSGSSEGSVGPERESGDGQESVPAKKVDDDEDKKNPQYIPKRGTFYEHDDRTADDIEDGVTEAEAEKQDKDGKKKVWQDKKEKWNHDKFDDSEQAPKSRAELVSIYGYDIRNEDGPPRARRRRRYGRGPNKYTRNWEDEDAYTSKPPVTRLVKKPPRKSTDDENIQEDFPPLIPDDNQSQTFTNSEHNNAHQSSDENGPTRTNRNSYNSNNYETSEINENSNSANLPQQTSSSGYQDSHRQPRVGSGRVVKPKREIKDSDYRGFTTKTRQVRNMKTDQKILPRPPIKKEDYIQSQNFTNRSNVQDLDKDMAKLTVQEGSYSNNNNRGGKHGGGQRQGSVPPRLQGAEQKGSKRYSSIRQRSLPESATPPFNQHSNYYPNEYTQQGQVPLPHQNTQVPQIAPPPLPQITQVPVTAAPILPPPQFGPPFPQPPAFLPPGVAPAPFLPQQTPQIINYVPSQPQFPQGYQGYQQQFNPVTVTQPTELYQPPSGITYYSTDQQFSQRAAVLKRPKAAIPIVAPPPIGLKGKSMGDKEEGYEGDGENLQQEAVSVGEQ